MEESHSLVAAEEPCWAAYISEAKFKPGVARPRLLQYCSVRVPSLWNWELGTGTGTRTGTGTGNWSWSWERELELGTTGTGTGAREGVGNGLPRCCPYFVLEVKEIVEAGMEIDQSCFLLYLKYLTHIYIDYPPSRDEARTGVGQLCDTTRHRHSLGRINIHTSCAGQGRAANGTSTVIRLSIIGVLVGLPVTLLDRFIL